jgi:hypothetical protein
VAARHRHRELRIVRRRLFVPITTKEGGANRDAVVRAFSDQYAANKADFAAEVRDSGYRDLLSSAYPIHPELFNRLYEEWSTLDRFQRTRGVLRLLALTIEGLWNGNSKDLLIMPSSMPIDDNDVRNELVKFLDNQWEPIIATDVDGAQSVPTQLSLSMQEIEQQFRRMVFNLAARNQDDHVNNIAFLMDRSGQCALSPAFDVSRSLNPAGAWTASQQMSVNGKRDQFTLADRLAAGRSAQLQTCEPQIRAHSAS